MAAVPMKQVIWKTPVFPDVIHLRFNCNVLVDSIEKRYEYIRRSRALFFRVALDIYLCHVLFMLASTGSFNLSLSRRTTPATDTVLRFYFYVADSWHQPTKLIVGYAQWIVSPKTSATTTTVPRIESELSHLHHHDGSCSREGRSPADHQVLRSSSTW